MKPIYRRLLIFVVALVVIAVGYFGYRFIVASQRGVPQEFSEARSQGAAVSEKIISTSNDIAAYVAQLSSTTSTPAIVSSTLSEVEVKVAELRVQAVELAVTLGTMTQAVQDIRSQEAQEAALESISDRLELVEHLVTYTDKVSQLTSAMRLRLERGTNNSAEIAILIKEINSEVASVNKLSRRADEAMERFNSLLR